MQPLLVCLVMSWTDSSQSWMLRSTAHILVEEARSCNATTPWSPWLAYWIQDYCACLPVSSRTSSSVYVFPATECEGPTIKATTTIVVVALPSRSDIATVNRWRSYFPSRCCTSLKCSLSLSRCHHSQLFSNFQTTASWLRSSVVRTSVSDRRTFPGIRSIDIYVGITSAIGQPTRPTQPFILPGSINV